MCSGSIAGVFACVVHVSLVCVWCLSVRLLFAGAMSVVCPWSLRFGYMAHTWAMVGKYGNYGWVVVYGFLELELLNTSVHQP